jgi:hypothetical protein
MKKTYFTIKEAEKLIPAVITTLNRAKGLATSLAMFENIDLEFDDPDKQRIYGNRRFKEHHKTAYEFYTEMEALDRLGVVLAELEPTMVNFYAKRDGKDIFLCWHQGERRIANWHDIGEECSKRRPLDVIEGTAR